MRFIDLELEMEDPYPGCQIIDPFRRVVPKLMKKRPVVRLALFVLAELVV